MRDLKQFLEDLKDLLDQHDIDGYTQTQDFLLVHFIESILVSLAVINEEKRKLEEDQHIPENKIKGSVRWQPNPPPENSTGTPPTNP